MVGVDSGQCSHPDHLGSSTVVTDHTGAVVQRATYTPFGTFANVSPNPMSVATPVNHFFTGQELDPSTELYHLGARYYDPALGRFTQPDPIIQDEIGVRSCEIGV